MGTSTEHKVEIVTFNPNLNCDEHRILASLLFHWRKDQDVTKFLLSQPADLQWKQHWEWYQSALHEQATHRFDYFIFSGNRGVGILHITLPNCEIGILIGEKDLWGKGIATCVLHDFIEKIKRGSVAGTELSKVHAVIHPENIASQKVFSKVGFINTHEPARNGQEKWVLK